MASRMNISENLYTAMHKCTRCGQCTYGGEEAQFVSLCPMQIKGKFFTFSAGGIMQLARSLYDGKTALSASVRDLLFLCTTCGACEVNCGVIEGHVDLFTLLKRELVKEGIPLLEQHGTLVENTLQKKTPYGGRLPERNEWLNQERRQKMSLRPEVFYYVGCVSSYRETEIPVALVSIFEKLRIPFTLSQEEWCCGAPLYFSGHEEKAYKLAEHNVDAVKKSGASTVVLSCPTCSMIFKRYYPRWLKKDLGFDVLHVSEFLEGLYGEGRLKFRPAGAGKVAAYHDPCHLGRGQGIYDAPRRVLRAIEGIEFRDPGRTMENSFCCGGGGLLTTGSPEFSDQLARERAAEMKETGAEWLVSACPACKESLKIAARTLKRGIKVMDLVELVDKNLAV